MDIDLMNLTGIKEYDNGIELKYNNKRILVYEATKGEGFRILIKNLETPETAAGITCVNRIEKRVIRHTEVAVSKETLEGILYAITQFLELKNKPNTINK